MKHVIRATPISIKGIATRGLGTENDDSMSQVSCVLGLSRNKHGEKTSPSLPIRNGRAKWSSTKNTSGHSNDVSLEASFGKEQTNKTFEVSVMLHRGNEQILVGVASLTFLSALIETEVEIPIYPIGSDNAIEISSRAKTRKKKRFLGGDHVHDSYFQSNPFIMVDGVNAVSFLGGDCERMYYSERYASIRLRCACLPTRYEHILLQFQKIIKRQSQENDSNTQKCLGSSGTAKRFSSSSSSRSSSRVLTSPHSRVSSKGRSSPSTTPSSESRNITLSPATVESHDSLLSPMKSYAHSTTSIFTPMSEISENTISRIDYGSTGMMNGQFSSGSVFDDLYSQPSSSITFSLQPDVSVAPQPDASVADSMDLKALYYHFGRKMNNVADTDKGSLKHQIITVMDSHLGRSLQKAMMEMKKGFLSLNKLGIGGFEQLEANTHDESMGSLDMTTTASSSFVPSQPPNEMRHPNPGQKSFNHEVSHHSQRTKDLRVRRRKVLGDTDYIISDTPTASIPSREASLARTSISSYSIQFSGEENYGINPYHSYSSHFDENGYSSWSGEYTPVFDKHSQERVASS